MPCRPYPWATAARAEQGSHWRHARCWVAAGWWLGGWVAGGWVAGWPLWLLAAWLGASDCRLQPRRRHAGGVVAYYRTITLQLQCTSCTAVGTYVPVTVMYRGTHVLVRYLLVRARTAVGRIALVSLMLSSDEMGAAQGFAKVTHGTYG